MRSLRSDRVIFVKKSPKFWLRTWLFTAHRAKSPALWDHKYISSLLWKAPSPPAKCTQAITPVQGFEGNTEFAFHTVRPKADPMFLNVFCAPIFSIQRCWNVLCRQRTWIVNHRRKYILFWKLLFVSLCYSMYTMKWFRFWNIWTIVNEHTTSFGVLCPKRNFKLVFRGVLSLLKEGDRGDTNWLVHPCF